MTLTPTWYKCLYQVELSKKFKDIFFLDYGSKTLVLYFLISNIVYGLQGHLRETERERKLRRTLELFCRDLHRFEIFPTFKVGTYASPSRNNYKSYFSFKITLLFSL